MSLPAQRHKLSRKKDQRRALLKSLSESLIQHESITTTKPKAKALRPYVEKLVTRAKEDNQHNRRLVMRKISTKDTLNKLFTDIGPRFKNRAGGYLRIESAGWRKGDNTQMATISFVTEEAVSKSSAKASTSAKTETKSKPEAKPAAAQTSKSDKSTKSDNKKAPAKKTETKSKTVTKQPAAKTAKKEDE
ncbi:MAG: 50S ribosomal protein L17 [Candidatus Saccharimonadales bacterium]